MGFSVQSRVSGVFLSGIRGVFVGSGFRILSTF